MKSQMIPNQPGSSTSSPALTIAVTAYHDTPLLDQCLASVRRVYPTARLIVIADGWDDPVVERIAKRHGAQWYYGERLFPLEKGAAMWRRYFSLFRQAPTEYLFRIDTDTLFHRQLDGLPTGRCYFGTLQEMEVPDRKEKIPFVQGGCMGFTAETVETICASGILDDEDLNLRPYETWGVGFSRYMPDRGLISVDKMMGYIAYKLGIPAVQHRDIYSHWYVNKGNARPGCYAVTHPHKLPSCRSEITLQAEAPDPRSAVDRCSSPLTQTQLGDLRHSLQWPPLPSINWQHTRLPAPVVVNNTGREVPDADVVAFTWDTDTWNAVQHLCGSQRIQSGGTDRVGREPKNGQISSLLVTSEKGDQRIRWHLL